jgi:hypothetical protein
MKVIDINTKKEQQEKKLRERVKGLKAICDSHMIERGMVQNKHGFWMETLDDSYDNQAFVDEMEFKKIPAWEARAKGLRALINVSEGEEKRLLLEQLEITERCIKDFGGENLEQLKTAIAAASVQETKDTP